MHELGPSQKVVPYGSSCSGKNMVAPRLLSFRFTPLVFLMLWGPSIGNAGKDCLTYAEARKIWPREHLYWHTAAHCWDPLTSAEWKNKSSEPARAQGSPDAISVKECEEQALKLDAEEKRTFMRQCTSNRVQ